MTTTDEVLRKADDALKTGSDLLKECKLQEAKAELRTAYQLYRKYDKQGNKIHEAAFWLALCIVEGTNSHEELMEAEDLLIRFIRDDDYFAGKIPRAFVLAKTYKMLGRTKIMRLVSNEIIAKATNNEERAYALAGAVYAAIPGTTEAYHYAQDALPLLQAMGTQSEALAIVLEGMVRAVEHLAAQDRLEYANNLIDLLKNLPLHPILPTLYEAYMVISYVYIEQANWKEGLQSAIYAINTAAANNDDLAVASIYNHIARLYDMMDEPRESAKAHFNALKRSVSFHGVDLLSYAGELKEVAAYLARYCDFRLAVSAQLLSLRCLIDSEDPTYDQIRESVIVLEQYERNLV